MNIYKTLKNVYYDVKHPVSFSSPIRLYKFVKKIIPHLKHSDVTDFLTKQPAYTLHKQVRTKFLRRKTIVRHIFQQMQADLIDVQHIANENDNMRYILTCIDVLSRRLYMVPLQNKKAAHVAQKFEKILDNNNIKIAHLQTDDGSEFKGAFKAMLHKRYIYHFTTSSDQHASIAERVQRTILSKMHKYFTSFNTVRYIETLPKMVQSYNNKVHSSTGMAPNDVNKYNEHIVWEKLYGEYFKQRKRYKRFKFGDLVRISKKRNTFFKGFKARYTKEIFKIVTVIDSIPPTYKLIDKNNEILKGIFYEPELTKVKGTFQKFN